VGTHVAARRRVALEDQTRMKSREQEQHRATDDDDRREKLQRREGPCDPGRRVGDVGARVNAERWRGVGSRRRIRFRFGFRFDAHARSFWQAAGQLPATKMSPVALKAMWAAIAMPRRPVPWKQSPSTIAKAKRPGYSTGVK